MQSGAHGYRSGGANSRSLFYAPFNPETVEVYEIGAKTEFLDNRARLNVAAYTGDLPETFSLILLRSSNRSTALTGGLIRNLRTTFPKPSMRLAPAS